MARGVIAPHRAILALHVGCGVGSVGATRRRASRRGQCRSTSRARSPQAVRHSVGYPQRGAAPLRKWGSRSGPVDEEQEATPLMAAYRRRRMDSGRRCCWMGRMNRLEGFCRASLQKLSKSIAALRMTNVEIDKRIPKSRQSNGTLPSQY